MIILCSVYKMVSVEMKFSGTLNIPSVSLFAHQRKIGTTLKIYCKLFQELYMKGFSIGDISQNNRHYNYLISGRSTLLSPVSL